MGNDAAPGRLRRLADRLWYGPKGHPPTSHELGWQDDRVLHDANGRRVGDAIANQPLTAAHDAVANYHNR